MSGAQDATELVVAQSGDIYVAPVGTTLPTDATTALNAAYYKLGLITEDGATINVSPEIMATKAWQKRQPVRRDLIGQDISVKFALEQWNAENLKLAFGGGAIVEASPGVFRYDFPADTDSLDERAIVIDWADGLNKWRASFARGNVTDAVETQLVRTAAAMLPITFEVLAPSSGVTGSIFTNDTAFHS